jgi:hypothetical protein
VSEQEHVDQPVSRLRIANMTKPLMGVLNMKLNVYIIG